jgi:hypothetical protein
VPNAEPQRSCQARWNTHFAIPVPVLTALHTKWHTARIHVKNTSRNQPNQPYTTLDTRLLSSPQLHSLDLTVLGNFNGSLTPRSEFQTLRNCLLQATNLKRLHLDANSANEDQKTWIESPQHLCFRPGDTFPPLHELSLKYDTYKLTEPHCLQWMRAMDFSHLRVLDLDHGCPEFFFARLTNHVPNLKALKFGFWPVHSGSRSWRCLDVSVMARFSASITALEELTSQNYYKDQFDSLIHGDDDDGGIMRYWKSLKKLHVSFSHYAAKGWDARDVRGIVERCTELRDVAVEIKMEQAENRSGKCWVSSYTHLPSLPISSLLVFETLTLLARDYRRTAHAPPPPNPPLARHLPRRNMPRIHRALGAPH